MTPWAPKTHRQTIREQRRGGLDPRLSACKRGYGRRWERQRKTVLAEEPICRICGHNPSTCVDHIIPRSQGGSDYRENLQGLCERCHNRKTATEDGGFGN